MKSQDKKTNITELDFNKPEDARRFLFGLSFNGTLVSGIHEDSGAYIDFAELTDEQAMAFARDIYANCQLPGLTWHEPVYN